MSAYSGAPTGSGSNIIYSIGGLLFSIPSEKSYHALSYLKFSSVPNGERLEVGPNPPALQMSVRDRN
jgi:hypothetical protein